MKYLNLIRVIIAAKMIVMTSTSLVSAKEQIVKPIGPIKPPIYYPQPVITKEYRVPGAAIIGAAKRHGYYFGVAIKDIPKGCKFIGAHWMIPGKSSCEIIGFKSNMQKCRYLRKGWTLKTIKFKNLDYQDQHTNAYFIPKGKDPLIQLWPWNRNAKAKVVSIDYIILNGPPGPIKKFEDAFSHCDDSSYAG